MRGDYLWPPALRFSAAGAPGDLARGLLGHAWIVSDRLVPEHRRGSRPQARAGARIPISSSAVATIRSGVISPAKSLDL